MPGQTSGSIEWPYREGLRLDEAMHPLTILATGLYGEPMPNQNGAPIRLVVPWKYGFKSIKSIVRISLVADMPQTTWNMLQPNEYGFYSNVNPEVDHPRWSQASERRRRVGGLFGGRKDTLMFNGYADQVAGALRRDGPGEGLLMDVAAASTALLRRVPPWVVYLLGLPCLWLCWSGRRCRAGWGPIRFEGAGTQPGRDGAAVAHGGAAGDAAAALAGREPDPLSPRDRGAWPSSMSRCT